MFTGLIEEKGKILSLEKDQTNLNIEIQASKILEDVKLGDSIAVDGVCLTVTKFTDSSFWVTAIDETLKLTIIGGYQEGTEVNLERCLRLSDRLGGHLVAGHVDGIATIKEIKDLDGSREFFITVPEGLGKYIIHKGSIAVSGISLTVASITDELFSVAIIPETLKATTLGIAKAGDQVNIEVDQVAKYIEKQEK